MVKVKVGGKYMFSGRYVKVVKVGGMYIEVVWAHNGQTPKRKADRFISRCFDQYWKEI